MRVKIDGVVYAIMFSHIHVCETRESVRGTPFYATDLSGKFKAVAEGSSDEVILPLFSAPVKKVHGGSLKLRKLLTGVESNLHQMRKSIGATLCEIYQVEPGKLNREGKLLGESIVFCSDSERGFSRKRGRAESFARAIKSTGLDKNVRAIMAFVQRNSGLPELKAIGGILTFSAKEPTTAALLQWQAHNCCAAAVAA